MAESCRKLILAGKVVIALATLTAPATVAGLIQASIAPTSLTGAQSANPGGARPPQ
ncbi:MAG TPA: hypothetical protein VG100_06950 [Xanthobacteraceae bacterium]|nr:hypothetical protein [Xanthobacteraceae bacterium]